MRISPGFLFGVLVGIALALLFAPAPGEEMRDTLNKRTRQARERVRRYWEED